LSKLKLLLQLDLKLLLTKIDLRSQSGIIL
jgi:hypothetical protein